MTTASPLPYTASPRDYERQAEALLRDLRAEDAGAAWRIKWEHPRFRDGHATDVLAAGLEMDDARLVVARENGFEDWADLTRFSASVASDQRVARFEEAVEAVVSGDLPALRGMLDETPDLVRQRSSRRHHATLLHYVAANGVEGHRQKTPASAVEVAELLLDAGAEVDALADMYDARCTAMSMLVSSGPPAEAGLQGRLAETLLDHGAELIGPGSNWRSALMTALTFGYLDTARILVRRGAPLDDLAAVAGLGDAEAAVRLLPSADGRSRHMALALAAQLGHADVVRVLLDEGEDPDRHNPKGLHAHATPLHQAVLGDHAEVVRLLVERGARLDVVDRIYHGTPLDWAMYGNRMQLAAYLREHGAPSEFERQG